MNEQSAEEVSTPLIVGPILWISLGLACAGGALLIGAGAWKTPQTVGALGLGFAVALSILVGLLDSRSPAKLVLPVSICLILSLVSFAWWSGSVRGVVLDAASDHLPEMALKEAFRVEGSELSTQACEALIDRKTVSSELERLMSERPEEAVTCLTSPEIRNVERRDNITRRLTADWSARLRRGTDSKACKLVGPLGRLYQIQDGGAQRLLVDTLYASSSVTRECLTQTVQNWIESKSSELLTALGSADELNESLARRLQGALAANLASSEPEIDFGGESETMVGWTLRLSCRDDLAANPEVAQPVGELLRSRGCGTFDAEKASSIWPMVCDDLSDVETADMDRKACERAGHWARQEALEEASTRIMAALRAHRGSSTAASILAGDRLSQRDKAYDEVMGFDERIAAVENATNIPPSIRAQLLSELRSGRTLTRQISPESLALVKDVDKLKSIRDLGELRRQIDDVGEDDGEKGDSLDRTKIEQFLEANGSDLRSEEREGLERILELDESGQLTPDRARMSR